MSDKTVDYDRLAPTYDRRFQANDERGTSTALLALTRELGAKRILHFIEHV